MNAVTSTLYEVRVNQRMFSAKRLPLSAFRSPACWLYPLKPGSERKVEDVRQKTYTLIYPDPTI